jgi:ketosteroid isomerase-like protein
MSDKNVAKADAAPHIDTTPIHPTIEAHLDSLSSGDLDRLADTYHSESVAILNKPLARITQTKHTANGQGNIRSLLQCHLEAGTEHVQLRDYVHGKDLVAVQSTMTIRGQTHDAFAFYLLREGRIWRYIAGIYGATARFTPESPANLHPVFKEQMEHLARHDLDSLAKTYDPNAVMVIASTNSVAARSRGVLEGQHQIRNYIEKYSKMNTQMVELKQYTLTGDTLFVHGIMTSRGIAEHAVGAYVFSANKIIRQTSSVGHLA